MKKTFPVFLALAALLAAPAGTPARAGRGTGYVIVEGTVRTLEQVTLEDGSVQTVAVVGTDRGEVRLLLAPSAVLDEIGFELKPGDHVRARALATEGSEPAPVQKIFNLDRATRLRLRTFRGVPLWSNTGRFQGCGVEGHPAPRHGHGRHHGMGHGRVPPGGMGGGMRPPGRR